MSFGDFLSILPHLPTWVPVGWLLFGGFIWLISYWIARLSLQHPPHRRAVAGWLRYPTYTQLYRWACRPMVEWLWRRVGDTSVTDKAAWSAQAKGALTAKLYDKALLIAVVYPLCTAVGYWLWTGDRATIGGIEFARAEPSLRRLWILAPLAIPIFIFWLKFHFLGCERNSASSFAGRNILRVMRLEASALTVVFLSIIASGLAADEGSVTLGGAVGFASALPFAFSITGAFTIAGAIASAVSVAFAFLGILAIFIVGVLVALPAGAIATAVKGVKERLSPRAFYFVHFFCICALIIGWNLFVERGRIDTDDSSSILIFLGIFPLINGIFDWISYGVTLSLLRHGQTASWPFLWGLLDLIVASLLFLALGITLVAVLHGLDQLAGGALIDLPLQLAGVYALKDGDWSQSWALFMVFSTMVPTGLHVLISLIGLQGLWGHGWRRKLAGWIEVDAPSPLSQALLPMVLGVVWAAPIVAGCAVIWALIQWGKPLLGGFFQGYFNLLMWVAQWGGVI